MDAKDNNKGSEGSANGKRRRFRSKTTSTLKPIILSTFLIVLPIAFYWFVQIQNHQEYEKDKIYRTLRELELHISKELNALEGLEKVLPLESVLPGKLYKQQKEKKQKLLTNLDPCSALLIEQSGLKEVLKISTDVSGNDCKWSEEVKEELLMPFEELKNSYGNDKQEIIEALNDFSAEKDSGVRDFAGDFYIDVKPKAELKSVCSKNKLSNEECGKWENINIASQFLEGAKSITDVMTLGSTIYQNCSELTESLKKKNSKQTKQSKQANRPIETTPAAPKLNKSQQQLEEIIVTAKKRDNSYVDDLVDECDYYKDNYESLFEEFVSATTETPPKSVEDYVKVAESFGKIINVFYDTFELVSAHLIDLEGTLKQRVVPFQKIVSSSNMCVFISADKSSIGFDKVSIIEKNDLFGKFSSDIASCRSVLEGKNMIIIKKSLKDYAAVTSLADNRAQSRSSTRRSLSLSSRTKGNESNVVWLAVGVDSILKRYRRSLTYLEDIFLIDNSGEVFASFLGANKKSTTNTEDFRISNLKPLLNEAVEKKKEKAAEGETKVLGRVELNEIGHSVTQGRAVDPAWSYQASMTIEGAEYNAMVKPTSISLRDSKSVYKKNKLLLVGLKKPNQLNLMTERLSPLFHFTVLFLALLLLLTMPVLHVILTRKHNSYSSFSVGLFKVAVSLSVIVTFSSFSGYFTMLKHNLYSAELLEKSADKLLHDWQSERNSAIEFMQSVERCVFNPINMSSVQDTNCASYFKPENLEFYKDYEKHNGNEDSFASRIENIDSYVYTKQSGLPMLGLVFYTDENGIKEKPDWMARDYVPVRNKNVNLSQRNYFRSHQTGRAWQFLTTEVLNTKTTSATLADSPEATANPPESESSIADNASPSEGTESSSNSKTGSVHSQSYFVERIYNYIDGRKITQLSIPRTTQNRGLAPGSDSQSKFKGIISGEIMALTLESPVLPPAMRYAVVEKSTGKVLFHSEKEKVLVENFYDEMDDTDLAHAIRLNSDALEMIVYRSKKMVAYATPIPDTDWSLILLYDSSVAHGVVNEVAISVMIVLVILAILACAITYGLNWLLNNIQAYVEKTKVKKIKAIKFQMTTKTYAWIVIGTAVIFALVYNLLATGSGLIFVLAYLVLNFLLSTRCLIVNENQQVKAGNWLRTRPEYLTLFLVTLLALPSITMFIRWYNISTHQLQAYSYFEIQQKLAERKSYLENYRNVFWYENNQLKEKRWLNDAQQSLGMFAEVSLSDDTANRLAVTYDPTKILNFNTAIADNKYRNNFKNKAAENTDSENSKSTIKNESVNGIKVQAFTTKFDPANKLNSFLSVNRTTCLAHIEEDDETHQQWRSIPPLGQLAMLAYHIDGQHCDERGSDTSRHNDKMVIKVKNQLLADVLSPEISAHQHSEKKHRVTRLRMSEWMMYIFMLGLIGVIYIYTRRLISGVWTKEWLSQAYYSSKKNHQFSYPKHRLFISPETPFVEALIQSTQTENESIKDEGEAKVDSNRICHAVKSTAGKTIHVYLNIDLVTMDKQQRKSLLSDLEAKLCSNTSIIWMIAEISPLYRLMKSRAYPKANEAADISQAEVLRWANLFNKFYKDYHNGREEKLSGLLANPVPLQKNPSIPKVVESEFNGFYPDLRWIWNVASSTNEKPKTKTQAAEVCSIYAGPYYRFKWESCTRDERLVLYQVATGRYPSPKNNDVIEHLLRRGYLVANPFLQVANLSFKQFILNAELQDTFDEWEDEAEKSSWQQIRIYVGVLILLILAWLAYTSQDTYQQIAYLVGSLLTVFTALTQGANLLNLGGSKEGE